MMTIPSMPKSGRIIPTLEADGYTQMALDALLLRESHHRPVPVLRFYRWSGPWLSLGLHQRRWPSHWDDLIRRGTLSMVRRPSGGGAVLHAGGLTYALIWPDAPRQRHEAYRQACQWLIAGFNGLGLSLRFGDSGAASISDNCFARSTPADLVDSQGVKRIGSAQRWSQGHLLQHGEILLDPPLDLWREVFEEPAPASAPEMIKKVSLEEHLSLALKAQMSDTSWEVEDLSRQEIHDMERLASSPEVCGRIESTTWGSIIRPRG